MNKIRIVSKIGGRVIVSVLLMIVVVSLFQTVRLNWPEGETGIPVKGINWGLPIPFTPTITAYAATKINNVSIKFDAEEFDDDGNPIIGAIVKGNRYEAVGVDSAFDYFDTGSGYDEESNIFVVELSASDGYYFNITNSTDIKLSGAGAKFLKASRKDNGQTLVVTVQLEKLEEFLGEMSEAAWTEEGSGIWDSVYGACKYRLQLSNQKGKIKNIETGGTRYDFRPFMQSEGIYYYKVRPVSLNGKLGDWYDSGAFPVSEEQASKNYEVFHVDVRYTYLNGEKTPANTKKEYLNTGWQRAENGGIWFRYEDGSYPQFTWLREGDAWYFFDEYGYLVESEYVTWAGDDYYLGDDGKMLVSDVAPDGRKADQTGKLM